VQVPSTHTGVDPEQVASLVHSVPVVGEQTPLVQVAPFAHGLDALHPGTHWPSAQTRFSAQSLVYVHVSAGGVHALATHTSPPVQSLVAVQGHGPFVPPHAWQWLATHAEPLEQSLVVLQPFGVQAPDTQTPPVVQSDVVVQLHAGLEPPHATHWLDTHVWPDAQSVGSVHSTVVPGVVPGATHSPDVQTVPWGQSLLAEHVCVHPWVVHSLPVGHPLVLVHGVGVGGVTALQP
jgi:hypothetical protein